MTAPVPAIGWDATDEQWRAWRVGRCGGSDVTALLGFDHYRSPWQVWAEKTSDPRAVPDEDSKAGLLGKALEPWLIEQAPTLISGHTDWICPAIRPPSRSYQHGDHTWRVCSPDAVLDSRLVAPRVPDWADLVQCKTAGIVTGRAPGWTIDTVPLGYELQARWEMHVMDATTNTIVALVAGLGLRAYRIERDPGLEDELVDAVDEWWQRHIVKGEEPAFTGRDSTIIAALYPTVARATVDLEPAPAMELWQLYRDFREQEKEAAAAKDTVGTQLKALLGDAEAGLVNGQPIVTWGQRRGRINWEKLARELAEEFGVNPVLDDYRSPPTRALTIKE